MPSFVAASIGDQHLRQKFFKEVRPGSTPGPLNPNMKETRVGSTPGPGGPPKVKSMGYCYFETEALGGKTWSTLLYKRRIFWIQLHFGIPGITD